MSGRTNRHLVLYSDNEWDALCIITAQTNDSMATVIRILIERGLYHTAFCNTMKDAVAGKALMLWRNLEEKSEN